jgi:hypothetical protein
MPRARPERGTRTGSRVTPPASTPSNRWIPEPNSTGESATENASIRPESGTGYDSRLKRYAATAPEAERRASILPL